MAGTMERLMMGGVYALQHASKASVLSRSKMWSAFHLTLAASSANRLPHHSFARFRQVGSDQLQNCGSCSFS